MAMFTLFSCRSGKARNSIRFGDAHKPALKACRKPRRVKPGNPFFPELDARTIKGSLTGEGSVDFRLILALPQYEPFAHHIRSSPIGLGPVCPGARILRGPLRPLLFDLHARRHFPRKSKFSTASEMPFGRFPV